MENKSPCCLQCQKLKKINENKRMTLMVILYATFTVHLEYP